MLSSLAGSCPAGILYAHPVLSCKPPSSAGRSPSAKSPSPSRRRPRKAPLRHQGTRRRPLEGLLPGAEPSSATGAGQAARKVDAHAGWPSAAPRWLSSGRPRRRGLTRAEPVQPLPCCRHCVATAAGERLAVAVSKKDFDRRCVIPIVVALRVSLSAEVPVFQRPIRRRVSDVQLASL